MTTLLSGPLAQAIGWALLHLVWEGFVVAGIAGAVLALMHRRSANARYLVAAGALALIVVLGTVTAWRAYDAPQPLTPSAAVAAIAAAPAEAGETILASLPSPSTFDRLAAKARTHLPKIVLLWLAGVAILSTRLTFGWLQTMRMAKRSGAPASARWQQALARLAGAMQLRTPVTMLESVAVDVPTVIGWLRPVVLIPASTLSGLSPEQIEMVLAHELAHIRRHDFFFNLLQAMVETLLFYHPAVWWISRRMRIEREHCCDDMAIEICGNPLQYARALTRLEELRGSTQLAVAANGGSLITRIKRLVIARTEGPNGASRWAAGAALVTVLVVLTAVPSMPLFAKRNVDPAPKPAPAAAPAPAAKAQPAESRIEVAAPKANQTYVAANDDDDDHDVDMDSDDDHDLDVDVDVNPEVDVDLDAIDDAVNAAVEASTHVAPIPPATPVIIPQVHIAPQVAEAVRQATSMAMAEAPRAVAEAFRSRPDRRRVIGENGKLTVDDLIRLRNSGVTPEYIESMRRASLGEVTLNDAVRMREHGVTPEYVQQMRDAGVDIRDVDTVVALRDHGVTESWLKGMKPLGLGKYTTRDLIRLRDSGVDPSYVEAMKAAGYTNLSVDQLRRMREHGVDARFAREMSESGYPNLSAEALVRLRDHGVDARYVAAMAHAGFRNLSADELVMLRDRGVTPEFIKSLEEAGYTNMSASELARLASSGVNADFIRELSKYKVKDKK